MVQLSTQSNDSAYMQIRACYANIVRRENENKAQRNARIATEKMLASWDMHNKVTPTVKKQIQICKPRHKVNHMGKRF